MTYRLRLQICIAKSLTSGFKLPALSTGHYYDPSRASKADRIVTQSTMFALRQHLKHGFNATVDEIVFRARNEGMKLE